MQYRGSLPTAHLPVHTVYGFFTRRIPWDWQSSHGITYVQHGNGWIAVNARELANAGPRVQVLPYRGHR